MTVELKSAYATGNQEKDKVLSVAVHTPYTKMSGADGYRPGTIIPHIGGSTSLQSAERFNGKLTAEVVSYGRNDFKQLVPPVELHSQNIAQLSDLVIAAQNGTVPVVTPQPSTTAMPDQSPDSAAPASPATQQQLTEMMATMLAQVMGAAKAAQAPAVPIQPPAPMPMPIATPPQPGLPMSAFSTFAGAVPRLPLQQQASDAIADAFRSLGIPNLTPVPAPPKTKVDFVADPQRSQIAFTHLGYYHWVAVAGSVLLLIVDTRFDYPYWAPSDMGDNVFHITATGSDGQQPQTYDCRLCGAEFRFGNFRFFMLLVVPPMENY